MKILIDILLIFIIYIVIAFLWMLAEKIIYGYVTPRGIDSVIAIILAISLYINLK